MRFIDTAYAAEEAHTEVAVEHGGAGGGGVMASLGINGQQIVFQFINFGLVVLIVWFLILKPLTKKMAERQDIIDKSLENAKQVEENLKKSEEHFARRMEEAEKEARAVIQKAADEAVRAGEAIKDKTRKEIETLVSEAKTKIGVEREDMMRELKKETANFIVLALEKILSERITDTKDKQIIAEMVKKLQ